MKEKKVPDVSFKDPERRKKDDNKEEDQTPGRKSGRFDIL